MVKDERQILLGDRYAVCSSCSESFPYGEQDLGHTPPLHPRQNNIVEIINKTTCAREQPEPTRRETTHVHHGE